MATTTWADLPPDLLHSVIARLPFPGDHARLRAVCRAWRSSSVREHVMMNQQQLPWIVLPDCSFCTDGGASFHGRLPGVPHNATCLGATGAWLALDCTDYAFRRASSDDLHTYCPDTNTLSYTGTDPRDDVKHAHTYLLHNPFTNATVPLPELDAIIGHVAESFEVRKVLMRCPSAPADDVIAVTTNRSRYNLILCRPGRGTFVLPYCRVVDVAFIGDDDMLYGITSGDELLAFHLGEDEGGRPNVIKAKLVIRDPSAGYYMETWRWPLEYTSDVDVVDEEHGYGNDDGYVSSSSDEDNNGEFEGQDDAPYQEEDDETDDDAEDSPFEGHDDAPNQEEEDDAEDWYENDNEMIEGYYNYLKEGSQTPFDGTDEIHIARYLVQSQGGDELLMLRHRFLISPGSYYSHTLKLEVLKADVSAGRWVPVITGLAQGEAVFLGRSFSKCIRAYGGIREGLVYFMENLELDSAFDTRSKKACMATFRQSSECRKVQTQLLTWLFPPELVV